MHIDLSRIFLTTFNTEKYKNKLFKTIKVFNFFILEKYIFFLLFLIKEEIYLENI